MLIKVCNSLKRVIQFIRFSCPQNMGYMLSFWQMSISQESKVNGDNKFPDFVILMKSELQLVKENIHVLFIHFDRFKWKT